MLFRHWSNGMSGVGLKFERVGEWIWKGGRN